MAMCLREFKVIPYHLLLPLDFTSKGSIPPPYEHRFPHRCRSLRVTETLDKAAITVFCGNLQISGTNEIDGLEVKAFASLRFVICIFTTGNSTVYFIAPLHSILTYLTDSKGLYLSRGELYRCSLFWQNCNLGYYRTGRDYEAT